mmetsp:Transcript_13081/g.17838  ORF Transcript_13081/g.17838 Transcript_13081/m.17838 type:complete len:97 (-) Transcript_13081:376-666(-)
MVGCHSTATVPFPSVDPSAVPSSTSTTTLYNIWQSNLTVNSPTISSQSPVDQRTRSQGPFLGPTPCPHYGTIKLLSSHPAAYPYPSWSPRRLASKC